MVGCGTSSSKANSCLQCFSHKPAGCHGQRAACCTRFGSGKIHASTCAGLSCPRRCSPHSLPAGVSGSRTCSNTAALWASSWSRMGTSLWSAAGEMPGQLGQLHQQSAHLTSWQLGAGCCGSCCSRIRCSPAVYQAPCIMSWPIAQASSCRLVGGLL